MCRKEEQKGRFASKSKRNPSKLFNCWWWCCCCCTFERCVHLSLSQCIVSVVEMIYKTNEMKQIFRQHNAGVLCYRCHSRFIVVSCTMTSRCIDFSVGSHCRSHVAHAQHSIAHRSIDQCSKARESQSDYLLIICTIKKMLMNPFM